MPTTNDLYQEALFRHITGVDGFEQFLVTEAITILNKTELDLVAQIREELDRLGPGGRGGASVARFNRLNKSLQRILQIRTAAWADVNNTLRKQLRGLSKVEVDWSREAFTQSLQLEGIELAAPSTPALRAATFASPFRFNSNRSQVLASWMASLRQGDLSRIEEAVRLGFIEAEDVDSIIRRIRGTRAEGFKNGLLQITRNQTETVVRTSVNHFSNAARDVTWASNADIILALRWTAVLDGSTTLICQSRDGKVSPFGNNELPPNSQLLDPPDARPPAHAQCRSVMVAVISPEGVVGNRPFVIDTRNGRRREVDFRKMARTQGRPIADVRTEWAVNRVGRVPAETTYDTFLRRQSASFQDEVLGPTRGKLFRQGELESGDFVTNAGRRYSLSELRRRDAEAFSKAGI